MNIINDFVFFLLVTLTLLFIEIIIVFLIDTRVPSKKDELKTFFDLAEKASFKARLLNLDSLPDPVKRYMNLVICDKGMIPCCVLIKQRGVWKRKPDSLPDPVQSEEYFITGCPKFNNYYRVQIIRGLWKQVPYQFSINDGYQGEKLFSVIPFRWRTGKCVISSLLVQYISEAVWFPWSFLPSENIHWRVVDEKKAILRISHHPFWVSLEFLFDDHGFITSIHSEDRYIRYRGKKHRFPWTLYLRNYQNVNGVCVPVESETVWHLPEGDVSYAKMEIEEIPYDIPEPFRRTSIMNRTNQLKKIGHS